MDEKMPTPADITDTKPQPCAFCHGTGIDQTPELLRELEAVAKAFDRSLKGLPVQ